MQNLLGGTSMVIAMSFLYDGFIDYLLFIVGYEDWISNSKKKPGRLFGLVFLCVGKSVAMQWPNRK
ncbi:hypothetical protein BFQ18_23390 [Escherichia coli]|nr:hypothetical protein BFQ18_23390 [Escherichia coli]